MGGPTHARMQAEAVRVDAAGMPEEDGYDPIRKIRALPPDQGGSTPAVALTAFARSEDRRRVFLAGYQMHVAKPVEGGGWLSSAQRC